MTHSCLDTFDCVCVGGGEGGGGRGEGGQPWCTGKRWQKKFTFLQVRGVDGGGKSYNTERETDV